MKNKFVPQNPVILRCHRILEAFVKSDDEKDFYLDRVEGFILYVDLDKPEEELSQLYKELEENKDRYVLIPKLTFYEIKKVMEGFVNEKVYDIDTKEKLLDIIQSKEARENFLEFIYDHHLELEKWQQFYQERFRLKIIEWLRNNAFNFVFEEDVELTKSIVEKIKMAMFQPKAPKDIVQARKILAAKAATYYSNEALNPRPKRGRPPKQVPKVETEPQFSEDIYLSYPKMVKPFLFTPDYHSASMIFTFSGRFASEEDLLAHRRQQLHGNVDLQSLSQKLLALKTLSTSWKEEFEEKPKAPREEPALKEEKVEKVKPQKEQVKKPKPVVIKAPSKEKSKKQAPIKKELPKKPLPKKPLPKKVSPHKISPVKKAASLPKKTTSVKEKKNVVQSKKGVSKKKVTLPQKKKTTTKKR
jgi:hypothetical protein